MKNLSFFLLLLFFSSMGTITLGQQNCKVLIPSISGSYVGKCKKGLAHGKGKAFGVDQYEGMFRKGLPNGKGTYIWSNGDRFDGHWLAGQRDGKGIYTIRLAGRDSVVVGVWKAGEYIGPIPEGPKVIGLEYVEKYQFLRRGDGDKVLIDIHLNGGTNSDIEDLTLFGTSGTDIVLGQSVGFENISFPFICKVTYITWNKLHSAQHFAKFEFKITEPGEWLVVITN